MTLFATIILIYVLLIIAFGVSLKVDASKNSNKGIVCVFSVTTVYTILVAILISTCTIHGCYNLNIPVDKALIGVCNTPQEQSNKLNENLTSTLVYVYRFDCSDCTTLHSKIDSALSPYDHICVSFESPRATSFVKDTNVIYTPSIVAFNSQGDHMTQSIYTTNTQGNPVFNQHAFDELIKYMQT